MNTVSDVVDAVGTGSRRGRREGGEGGGADSIIRSTGGGRMGGNAMALHLAVISLLSAATVVVYASSCPSEPLARIIVFIPPALRIGNIYTFFIQILQKVVVRRAKSNFLSSNIIVLFCSFDYTLC